MLLDQVSYIKVAFNIMINGKVIYNRIPNASRTHPEGKQSDSIRKNAPKDTTFIQKSRHKTVKSIQKSRLTPVKQPEQRTPVQRAASLLAIYYTDGVIINRHVPSLSTRCTYPLVVNCFSCLFTAATLIPTSSDSFWIVISGIANIRLTRRRN